MGKLDPKERPSFGRQVNEVRDELENALSGREADLFAQEERRRLLAESLDISLPGRAKARGGTLHPVTRIINETKDIFLQMGYAIVEGPEVEWDYYNFEALNIPPDHPARDMQDTFFLSQRICCCAARLLRSKFMSWKDRILRCVFWHRAKFTAPILM